MGTNAVNSVLALGIGGLVVLFIYLFWRSCRCRVGPKFFCQSKPAPSGAITTTCWQCGDVIFLPTFRRHKSGESPPV